MTNHYMLRLLAFVCLLTSPALAQKASKQKGVSPIRFKSTYEEFAFRHRQLKADPIICYGLKRDAFTSIGTPADFKKGRRAPTSTFIVKYVGYPDEARAAFQRAVDIWSNIIVSPIPIRITAFWEPLGGGDTRFVTLGSAGPTDFIGSPDGGQQANTFYPIALAEKITRRQLNHPDSADIQARFNSDNSWYLGLDAKPTAGRSDLVSVVLHELGHGLGFTGGVRRVGETNEASYLPIVYDRFIENNTGQKLTDPESFSSRAVLYTQITGRNLFINGPILRQKTGDRARIFAPATYSTGSSVYHLDEGTYPSGTANSLMTPNINNAEAIHDPGPITRAFFEDMEWKTTSLLHEPIADFETVAPQTILARVFSDTTLGSAPPQFFYRQGYPTDADNQFRGVNMTRIGTTNSYTYTLPVSELTGRIAYYIRTQDGAGRTYSNPGRDIKNNQFFYSFVVGPDRVAPRITHTPDQTVLFAAQADTIPILAQVTDDRTLGNARKRGIDTVYVEYRINTQAARTLPLFLLDNSNFPDSTWGNLLILPRNTLRGGDKISYRIVARDISAARNQALSPATGFYEINIVAPQATVRTQYVNDFTNTATSATEFAGNGFRIETPTGFLNPSINTDHPYKDGADLNNQSYFTYALLAPIRVKSNPDSAKIRFDEIVLVEPGEPGTTYLDEGFYDYVIVEGSKDNGRTWAPLIDGYDSSNRPEWANAWKSRFSPRGPFGEQNSLATGSPSLSKPREIGILDNGFFRPNDVIIVRFALFTDQLSHGWGWQVDNLSIQSKPIVLATEPAPLARFETYPNPTTNSIRITAELTQDVYAGTLTLSTPTGQAVRNVPVSVQNKRVSEQLDVSQLPSGVYFLQLNAGDAKQTKKIVVTH